MVCICTLYKQDTERIGTYCTIVIMYRHANMAQSLDGYLWAVSSLKKEKDENKVSRRQPSGRH